MQRRMKIYKYYGVVTCNNNNKCRDAGVTTECGWSRKDFNKMGQLELSEYHLYKECFQFYSLKTLLSSLFCSF